MSLIKMAVIETYHFDDTNTVKEILPRVINIQSVKHTIEVLQADKVRLPGKKDYNTYAYYIKLNNCACDMRTSNKCFISERSAIKLFGRAVVKALRKRYDMIEKENELNKAKGIGTVKS